MVTVTIEAVSETLDNARAVIRSALGPVGGDNGPGPEALSTQGVEIWDIATALTLSGFDVGNPYAWLAHVVGEAVAAGIPVIGYPPPTVHLEGPPDRAGFRVMLDAAVLAYGGPEFGLLTEEQLDAFIAALVAHLP